MNTCENLKKIYQHRRKSRYTFADTYTICGFSFKYVELLQNRDDHLLKFCDWKGAKGCKDDKSSKEPSNEDSSFQRVFGSKNRLRYSRERARQRG